jgi:branched-chain amino acid transport system substrate-binding protein
MGLALAFAVVAGDSPAQDNVEIGLIDMYGGGFAAQANAIRAGFEIALDEANGRGGVQGRKLVLTTADMGISVEKAITEARRMLLDRHLRYVNVGSHSGAAVALAQLLKGQDAFGLGAFATTKRFTGEEGNARVGRANLSTVEIGRVMAEHLKDMPTIKRVAMIAPDFEFGKHFVEDLTAALKAARPEIAIIRVEWPKFGAPDFTPHVTALQAVSPDMVLSALFSGDLVNFLKAAKGFGLFEGKTKFFTSGLDLLKVSTFADALPEGTIATVWYPFYALQGEKNAALIAEVEKRSRSYPTGSHLVGYVAGKMLSEAIIKGGKPDDPAVTSQAVDGLEFDSPVGPVKVRACDKMALYNFFVGTVKRDAKLPDGIGVADVKAYNTADHARSCDEIKRVRTQQ